MTTDIHVIQPSELGSDFLFDPDLKKWKLTNPAVQISNDADNALIVGSDDGVFLDKNKLKKYHLIQDNVEAKYKMYSFATDTFDILTATLVSEVNMGVFHAELDDISIPLGSSVITFIDKTTNETIVFDTSSPIFSIMKANTNAIQLSGNGKDSALSATLVIDPSTDNLLKVNVNGAIVNKQDILAILNSNPSTFITNSLTSENNTLTSTVNGQTETADIINNLELNINSATSRLTLNVNGVLTAVGINQIKNTAGDSLGFTIDYPV